MRLPFGTDAFFDVFVRYNEAIWPAQVALVLLALLAAALAARGGVGRSRIVAGVLALFWLWMGAVYHLAFFRAINPAAVAFGVAFVVQAALLVWYGVRGERLVFSPRADPRGVAGALLVAYAIVGYPLLGAALGHVYPAAPTFGLPCPTTIFTLGLLLWVAPTAPWAVLAIPLGWAVVGTSAAVQLGVREDFGLAAAALIVAAFAVLARVRPTGAPRPDRRRQHGGGAYGRCSTSRRWHLRRAARPGSCSRRRRGTMPSSTCSRAWSSDRRWSR